MSLKYTTYTNKNVITYIQKSNFHHHRHSTSSAIATLNYRHHCRVPSAIATATRHPLLPSSTSTITAPAPAQHLHRNPNLHHGHHCLVSPPPLLPNISTATQHLPPPHAICHRFLAPSTAIAIVAWHQLSLPPSAPSTVASITLLHHCWELCTINTTTTQQHAHHLQTPSTIAAVAAQHPSPLARTLYHHHRQVELDI